MMHLTDAQTKELQSLIATTDTKDVALRAQAILISDEFGRSGDIERLTGYTRTWASDMKRRYQDEGIDCLTDKRTSRGRELLSTKERDEVASIVKTKTPSDYGYRGEFWTTRVLGDFIKERYGVEYKSRTSLYLIFRHATFSYHKPGLVYDLRDEAEVQAWRKKAAKRLERALTEQDVVILAGDEMVLTAQTTTQYVWLPRGEYPIVEVKTGTKERRHVYGFLDLQTDKDHAYKTERQNMYVSVTVLKQLRKKYPRKKLLLFWDNAGWHKGRAVQEFIAADGRIEICWFPPYAPDEDPQEGVWKAGRGAITHNTYIDNIDRATDELVAYCNTTLFPYRFLGRCLVS